MADDRMKDAGLAVRTMLDFGKDDEDVAVNGLDKRNRQRLVRAVARALRVLDQERARPTIHQPRCPSCGSERVGEWGKVLTGYYVASIDSNGVVDTDDSIDTAWDSYEYVELMCRDCDHTDADPTKFLGARISE